MSDDIKNKPEGPAQEPQLAYKCPICCADFIAQGKALAGDMCPSCSLRGPYPATPAPSYPSELPASKLSWPQLPEPSARAVEAARRIIHFFRANPRVMRETVVGRIIDDIFESAPSQPAGAREWLLAQHRANPGHVNWRLMLRHEDIVVELLEAYARQQTAAKDAEISEARRLISEYIDTINSFDALGSVAARDRLRAFMKGKPVRNQRAEAAEHGICVCTHPVHDHEADDGCTRCGCAAYKPAATVHGTGSGKPLCKGPIDSDGYHCICSNYHEHNGKCRHHNQVFHNMPTSPASPTVTLRDALDLLQQVQNDTMGCNGFVHADLRVKIRALLRAAERQPTVETLQLLLEQSQKENALLYEELTQLKARIKELMNHLSSSGT